MFIDYTLILADTVTVTTSAASTNYIDTQAAGNDYKDMFFFAKVETTAFTAGAGAPSVNFELQTSDSILFLDATTFTLCAATGLLAANLTASTIVARIPIPMGAKRYIRGYYNITNYAANTVYFSACSYSMFLATDVDGLITGAQ